MDSIPKLLIGGGVILIVAGLLWGVGGKYLQLGRLPGDIVIQKENVRFYFPVVTCIVISVVVSLGMYLIRWFTK